MARARAERTAAGGLARGSIARFRPVLGPLALVPEGNMSLSSSQAQDAGLSSR